MLRRWVRVMRCGVWWTNKALIFCRFTSNVRVATIINSSFFFLNYYAVIYFPQVVWRAICGGWVLKFYHTNTEIRTDHRSCRNVFEWIYWFGRTLTLMNRTPSVLRSGNENDATKMLARVFMIMVDPCRRFVGLRWHGTSHLSPTVLSRRERDRCERAHVLLLRSAV